MSAPHKQMLLVLLLACANPAFAAKAPAPAKRITQNDFLHPWLRKDEALAPKHLQKLIDLAARNPRSQALTQAAFAKVRAKSTDEFFKYFAPVTPGTINDRATTQKGGEFNPGDYWIVSVPIAPEHQFLGGDITQLEPYRTRIAETAAEPGVHEVSVDAGGTEIQLHVFANPHISLATDGSLQQSYENFMHELAHFTRFDLMTEPKASAFDNESDYVDAYLLSPGQEIDARLEGVMSVTLALGKLPYFSSLPVSMDNAFKKDGTPVGGPASLITTVKSFLGYDLSGTWKNRLEVRRGRVLGEAYDLKTTLARTPSPYTPTQIAAAQARLEALSTEEGRIARLLSTVQMSSF